MIYKITVAKRNMSIEIWIINLSKITETENGSNQEDEVINKCNKYINKYLIVMDK